MFVINFQIHLKTSILVNEKRNLKLWLNKYYVLNKLF